MFEWDARKADMNRRKHGVSFDEATTVFADPDALDGPDFEHSDDEARYLRIGWSAASRVLIVAYTTRRSTNGETIRVISARRANRKEITAYRSRASD